MNDLIHVVETAYRLEASTDTEWLKSVAEAVRAHLSAGEAALAFTYETRNDGWMDVRSVAELGTPSGFASNVLNIPFEKSFAESFRHSGGLQSAVGWLRGGLSKEVFDAYYERNLLAHGLRDLVVVHATDATPSGSFIGVPSLTEGLDGSLRKQRKTWNRIAAHIAAGHRLRRRISKASPADGASKSDAILTPGGRVEHATGTATQRSARDVLRSAVLAVDRARGPLRRRDPEEAVEVWRGLVAGRWSLVDRFDSDGRRYVVAHRNDPEAPDPRALSLRERQVLGYANLGHSNKLIAYELGLASSTVGVLLARARAKLGTRSSSELEGAAATPVNEPAHP